MGGGGRNRGKLISNDTEWVGRHVTHESHLENGSRFESHVLTPDFLMDLVNGLGNEFLLVILVCP